MSCTARLLLSGSQLWFSMYLKGLYSEVAIVSHGISVVPTLLLLGLLLLGCENIPLLTRTTTPTPPPATSPAAVNPLPSPSPAMANVAPRNADPPRITKHGFGEEHLRRSDQLTKRYGFAFFVENPNADVVIAHSDYQVIAYDSVGSVLKTTEGTIPLLWPEERTGIANTFEVDRSYMVARIEVNIEPRRYAHVTRVPDWTADNISYIEEQPFAKVTALIRSTFTQPAHDVRASAVLYDANDQIIGGGYTYIDFVPVSGQAAVEIPVVSSARPTRVEVYPKLSTLSLLGATQ